MNEKLLSVESAKKFSDFSSVISIKEFVAGARKAFVNHTDDKDYTLFERKMNHIYASYK